MLPERFWSKVTKSDSCWVWNACHDVYGYGFFTVAGKNKKAHRVIWEDLHGLIPPGGYICHTCDNPPCVNPDHLWLGTPQDNARDMHAKGRAPKNNAKLTPEQVAEIRSRHSGRRGDTSDLAREFAVSRTTIQWIISNGTWRDLEASDVKSTRFAAAPDVVEAIRSRFTDTRGEIAALAREYNVSKYVVRSIVRSRVQP